MRRRIRFSRVRGRKNFKNNGPNLSVESRVSLNQAKSISDQDDFWDGLPPKLVLLEHHFRERGLYNWDNARVLVLAKTLRVTIRELCAMAGEFSKARIKKNLHHKEWPLPIALHFERMESIADSSLFRMGPKLSKSDEAILQSGILCP